MVRFTAQFIEIGRGRNTSLDCVQYLTHETEKQQALGKHHYDDSEIKANSLTSAQLVEREEMLALRSFLNETDPLRVLYKGMTIRQGRAKSNRLSNDSEKLDKFRVKYITETAQCL